MSALEMIGADPRLAERSPGSGDPGRPRLRPGRRPLPGRLPRRPLPVRDQAGRPAGPAGDGGHAPRPGPAVRRPALPDREAQAAPRLAGGDRGVRAEGTRGAGQHGPRVRPPAATASRRWTPSRRCPAGAEADGHPRHTGRHPVRPERVRACRARVQPGAGRRPGERAGPDRHRPRLPGDVPADRRQTGSRQLHAERGQPAAVPARLLVVPPDGRRVHGGEADLPGHAPAERERPRGPLRPWAGCTTSRTSGRRPRPSSPRSRRRTRWPAGPACGSGIALLHQRKFAEAAAGRRAVHARRPEQPGRGRALRPGPGQDGPVRQGRPGRPRLPGDQPAGRAVGDRSFAWPSAGPCSKPTGRSTLPASSRSPCRARPAACRKRTTGWPEPPRSSATRTGPSRSSRRCAAPPAATSATG